MDGSGASMIDFRLNSGYSAAVRVMGVEKGFACHRIGSKRTLCVGGESDESWLRVSARNGLYLG